MNIGTTEEVSEDVQNDVRYDVAQLFDESVATEQKGFFTHLFSLLRIGTTLLDHISPPPPPPSPVTNAHCDD